MRRWLRTRTEWRLWIGLLAILPAGGWLSGVLFQAGKAFAEVSQGRRIHDSLDGLAAWCAETDFPGFLRPALILTATLAWVPLREWLRRQDTPPPNPPPENHVATNPTGSLRTSAGAFLLAAHAACLLAALRWPGGKPTARLIEQEGLWFWTGPLLTALGSAFLLEWLFRSTLFRAFLQRSSARAACWQSALVFATFLYLAPPSSWPIPSPDEGGTGLSMLAAWLMRLLHPGVLLGEFLPLLLSGLLLAWTRLRSGTLTLPLALQAGYMLGQLPVLFLTGGQALRTLAELRGTMALLHPLLACLCLFALWKWLSRPCSEASQPPVTPPPDASLADETAT